MLKITKSLFLIVAVAALAAGATGAYFSDTVNITGNSFTTGSIKIAVTGLPDAGHFAFSDMKPGYIQHSDFTVTNTGTNPANITKTVSFPVENVLGGVINYKVSVEVFDGSTLKWYQMLYNYDTTLAAVNNQPQFLGMLPTGWIMKVNESYMMDVNADGDQYQNQTMNFDIAVKAEQLTGSLTLENKTGDPNWDIVQGDSAKGTLSYGVMDQKFNYTFTGVAPQPSANYTLVIGNNPYNGGTTLGTGTTNGSGNIALSGSLDLGTLTNQKVWLVLSADWNGSGTMVGWNPTSYLFETGLIDYYKSL